MKESLYGTQKHSNDITIDNNTKKQNQIKMEFKNKTHGILIYELWSIISIETLPLKSQ